MRCRRRKRRPGVCGHRDANPASSVNLATSSQSPKLSGLGFFVSRMGMVMTREAGKTKWMSPHRLQQSPAHGKHSINIDLCYTSSLSAEFI